MKSHSFLQGICFPFVVPSRFSPFVLKKIHFVQDSEDRMLRRQFFSVSSFPSFSTPTASVPSVPPPSLIFGCQSCGIFFFWSKQDMLTLRPCKQEGDEELAGLPNWLFPTARMPSLGKAKTLSCETVPSNLWSNA